MALLAYLLFSVQNLSSIPQPLCLFFPNCFRNFPSRFPASAHSYQSVGVLSIIREQRSLVPLSSSDHICSFQHFPVSIWLYEDISVFQPLHAVVWRAPSISISFAPASSPTSPWNNFSTDVLTQVCQNFQKAFPSCSNCRTMTGNVSLFLTSFTEKKMEPQN